MEIFHYLAVVLKNVPLFESCSQNKIERTGSMYNDFDFANPFDNVSSFQNVLKSSNYNDKPVEIGKTVSQDDIDYAVCRTCRK